MANADVPFERVDLLDCPICLQTFNDPVLLGDCGHTFCRQCVERIQAPLRCPTCRSNFTARTILPNFALRMLLRERSSPAPASPAPASGRDSIDSSRALVRRKTEEQLADIPAQEARLVEQGVPAGLAKLIREEDSAIAIRIFLLDNSGSTAHPDGQFLEALPDGFGMRLRRCTRWQEVCNTAKEQARWNLLLGTPCEFYLLNPLARGETLEEGLDFICVDASRGNHDVQLEALEKMLASTGPSGVTPIADRLRKIHARISPEARELARHRQKVVLVIITDGLPSSTYNGRSGPAERMELVQELRRLSSDLPMHLVVRLCTNDDSIAEFYNEIDEETEIELEVVDDMESEAREIWKTGNRWLVYSPLIHRMREGGTLLKLFDLLDERLLDPMEVSLFCQLLLRESIKDGPLPSEAHEFCQMVRDLLPELTQVYDPMYRTMAPPLRIHEVEWSVLPPGPMKRICGNACQFM